MIIVCQTFLKFYFNFNNNKKNKKLFNNKNSNEIEILFSFISVYFNIFYLHTLKPCFYFLQVLC